MKRLLAIVLFLAAAALAPTAGAQSTHNIQISWNYTQGTDLAVGFNVYRASTSGGTLAKLTATPLALATLSYQDFSGVGNTTYFYVVTAVDIGGIESVDSNQASATFVSSSPNAPTNATATAH